METLAAINRWLAKQHVVTWCVYDEGKCGAQMRFTTTILSAWPSTS
jgi:uncharacterized protein YhbP (UPF0306 family)